MEELIRDLEKIIGKNYLKEKIILIPSYISGYQFLESLAKKDIQFLNFKIMSFNDLANKYLSDYIFENNLEYIDNTVSFLLVKNIIRELYQDNKLNYFAKLELNDSFIRSLSVAIFSLRMAAKNSKNLSRNDFIKKEKGQDIIKIMKEYELLLETNKYLDKSEILRLFINRYDENNDEKIYIIPENIEFTYLENKVLKKIPGNSLYNLKVSTDLELKSSIENLNIDIEVAFGESNEIKGIIRKIKENNLDFDKVNIFYTRNEPYTQLLYQLSQKYNLPVTFQNGISIKNTKPAQLLSAIFKYLSVPYTPSLKSIFSSSFIKIDHRKKEPFNEITKSLDQIKKDNGINPFDFCEKLIEILENFSVITKDIDGEAKNSLVEVLKKAANYSKVSELNEMIFSLEEMIEEMKVGTASSKAGYIHFCSYKNGIWNKRKYNFIVGLDEIKFPGLIIEDPILLDEERKNIGNLDLMKNSNKEKINMMNKLINSIDSNLYLFYSNYNTVDNREIAPSSLLLKIYRLLKNNEELNFSDFAEFISNSHRFIPQNSKEIIDKGEHWLYYDDIKGIINKDKIFSENYPDLKRGEIALRKRKEGFNKYNGNINLMTEEVDSILNGYFISASRLEKIAQCPYGYFLEYILGIKVPEDEDYDNESWLDPLNRGTLLHKIYENFYKNIFKKDEKADYEKHKNLMNEIVEREVKNIRKKIAPPSRLVYEREVAEIKESADLFLKIEEDNKANIKPVYFEFTFGFGDSDYDHVEIKLPSGKTIYLGGKIDRIDQVGKYEYNIIDYKTGKSNRYNNSDYFKKGRQLQHALYALAFEKIMDEKVEINKSIYYFPTIKGEGKKIVRFKEGLRDRNEVKDLVDNLLDILTEGNFAMRKYDYNNRRCSYCDYNIICDRERFDNITSFLKDESITELDKFRRLEKYE